MVHRSLLPQNRIEERSFFLEENAGEVFVACLVVWCGGDRDWWPAVEHGARESGLPPNPPWTSGSPYRSPGRVRQLRTVHNLHSTDTVLWD